MISEKQNTTKMQSTLRAEIFSDVTLVLLSYHLIQAFLLQVCRNVGCNLSLLNAIDVLAKIHVPKVGFRIFL